MDLSNLQTTPGSRQSTKRKGRGFGTGVGKTAGRGQKGQKAREGKKVRLGFEGGQMPLFRRMPKRGFNNISRKEYAIVNLTDLDSKFKNGAEVTPVALYEAGLIKQVKTGVKILGNGSIEKKLTVSADKFSKSAIAAIEKAGGKIQLIEKVASADTKEDKK